MKLMVGRRLSKASCVTDWGNKVPNPTYIGIYTNGEYS